MQAFPKGAASYFHPSPEQFKVSNRHTKETENNNTESFSRQDKLGHCQKNK